MIRTVDLFCCNFFFLSFCWKFELFSYQLPLMQKLFFFFETGIGTCHPTPPYIPGSNLCQLKIFVDNICWKINFLTFLEISMSASRSRLLLLNSWDTVFGRSCPKTPQSPLSLFRNPERTLQFSLSLSLHPSCHFPLTPRLSSMASPTPFSLLPIPQLPSKPIPHFQNDPFPTTHTLIRTWGYTYMCWCWRQRFGFKGLVREAPDWEIQVQY